jgi:glutamate/tyrosine decarboxylase-like PLP-dependent enzyme
VPCLPGREAVDPAALDARLARIEGPAVIVASAGEVNTGDFDDLVALAEIAERRRAWLHVDGAIGLPAACAPSHAHLVRGLERADSIAGDAHKWLNVPYDAGFVFTRHLAAQEAVFRAAASYLGAGPDLLHRTPENSRRFRALPTFLSLLAYGRRGQRAIVDRAIACAELLAARLPPSFELLAPVRLNVVCFALRGADEAATTRLLRALQEDGRAFLTPTTLRGRPALRAAFSNWATTERDVALVVEALADAARKIQENAGG